MNNITSAFVKLFVFTVVVMTLPFNAMAQTNIGNGTKYQCHNGVIIVVQSEKQINFAKLKKRITARIIALTLIINNPKTPVAVRNRAINQRTEARQIRITARECAKGETADLLGDWNLISENDVPVSGFTLVLELKGNSFKSTIAGSSNCNWQGTYAVTGNQFLMSTTEASGPPCDAAVGETREAEMILSSDKRQLTLDFTGSLSGALQVYQRQTN